MSSGSDSGVYDCDCTDCSESSSGIDSGSDSGSNMTLALSSEESESDGAPDNEESDEDPPSDEERADWHTVLVPSEDRHPKGIWERIRDHFATLGDDEGFAFTLYTVQCDKRCTPADLDVEILVRVTGYPVGTGIPTAVQWTKHLWGKHAALCCAAEPLMYAGTYGSSVQWRNATVDCVVATSHEHPEPTTRVYLVACHWTGRVCGV